MKHLLLCCLLCCLSVTAFARTPIPELTSPVIDTTGTLSAGETQRLLMQAMQLQLERGAQLQILIIPSTEPEDIAQFSQRAFDEWKLGRKKVDDGVLLVVAKKDRRVRIHVGYGLEGVIPDVTAARIINEHIVPVFKRGDYAGGVLQGSQVLTDTIKGKNLLLPELSFTTADDTASQGITAIFTIFLMIANLFLLNFIIESSVIKHKRKYADNETVADESSADEEPPHLLRAKVRAGWIKAGIIHVVVYGVAFILLAYMSNMDDDYIHSALASLLFLEVFILVLLAPKNPDRHLPGSAILSSSGRSWSGGSSRSSGWSGGGGRSGGGGASGRW